MVFCVCTEGLRCDCVKGSAVCARTVHVNAYRSVSVKSDSVPYEL